MSFVELVYNVLCYIADHENHGQNDFIGSGTLLMYLCHLYPDELTDLLGFDSKDLTLDRLETMLEEQIPLTGDSLVDIDWRPDHDDPSTGFFVVSINPGYL